MFLTYLTRRLALSIIALFGVVVVAFLIAHMVPADPLAAVLSDQATKDPAVREAYMKRWGLDRPVPEQFVRYLANVLRGDLGESFTTRRPVLQDLKQFLPGTVELAVTALVVSLLFGVPLGNLGGPASQQLGRSRDARGVSGGRGGPDLLDGPDRPPRLLLPSRVGARAGSARHPPPDATGRHGLRPRRQPPHREMASASPPHSAIPSCRPSCWAGSSWASSRELRGRRCSRCSTRTTYGRRGPRGSGRAWWWVCTRSATP